MREVRRGVDRAPEAHGGQDHGRVHDDACQGAEDKLPGGLPIVGTQFPEVVRHVSRLRACNP